MSKAPHTDFGFIPGLADDPDRWLCRDGRALLPSEMSTQHLKHTIALIERVRKARVWSRIHPRFRHSTPSGARKWIDILTEELARRG